MAVEVGECYSVEGSTYRDGVYRVVGVEGRVALLQVGDANRRRVHTGRVVYVSCQEVQRFEVTREPSETYVQRVVGRLRLLPYEVRTTVRRARRTPVVAGGSLLLVLVGVGLELVSGAEVVSGLVLLVGCLGLAASVTVWYDYKVRRSSN